MKFSGVEDSVKKFFENRQERLEQNSGQNGSSQERRGETVLERFRDGIARFPNDRREQR